MRRFAFPLILLAAACGDDGGNNTKTDGGIDIDGSDVDAAPNNTPVKITVKSNGTPLAGVRVHFQNPDSTLIASVDTDVSGIASSPMPNGGFVTAVDPFADAPGGVTAYLNTYAGVKPGDELELFDVYSETAQDITITAPTDIDGSVTSYRFSSPCFDQNETGPVAQITLDADCTPTTDIMITSLDDNDEIVHWLYVPGADTSGATLDLSAMALDTVPVSKTFTFNNIPVSAQGVLFDVRMASANGEIIDVSGGDIGTTVASTLKLAPVAGGLEVLSGFSGGPFSGHAYLDWAPYSATAYTTDIGARLLKEATSYITFNAATHGFEWTEAATGETADFVRAGIQAFRSPSLYINWTIVAPHAPGQFTFPTLPVETTDYNLQATDTIDSDGVQVSLGKVPGGYDAVREKMFVFDSPVSIASIAATGIATLQELEMEDMGLLAPLQRKVNTVKRHASKAWSSKRRR